MRLVDGNGPHEGRVELCSGAKWTTVCHHGWGGNEAAVVCHQLGFPSQSMYVTVTVHVYQCSLMLCCTFMLHIAES